LLLGALPQLPARCHLGDPLRRRRSSADGRGELLLLLLLLPLLLLLHELGVPPERVQFLIVQRKTMLATSVCVRWLRLPPMPLHRHALAPLHRH
jgi:hypothetical protein